MSAIRKLPFFGMVCRYLSLFLLAAQLFSCGSAKPLYPTNVTKSNSIEDFYGVAVAVLDFTNNTDIPQAGDVMQSAFAMAVMRSGKFELVDRSHMDVLLGERDLTAEGVADKDPTEIGRLLGVRAIIVGSVTRAKPYKYAPPKPPTMQQEQSTTVIVDQPDRPDKKNVTDDDSDDDSDGGGPWGWIVAGVLAVAAIVTFYWLWGPDDNPDAAEIGAYVKLIDVDTGKVLWQAEETYSGGDPRVQALTTEDKHEELEKEMTAVAGLLSEELVKTM